MARPFAAAGIWGRSSTRIGLGAGLALKIAGPEVPPLARLQAAEIAAEPQLAPSPVRAAQARRLLQRDVASLRACAEVS